jgi:hypothetical protein
MATVNSTLSQLLEPYHRITFQCVARELLGESRNAVGLFFRPLMMGYNDFRRELRK